MALDKKPLTSRNLESLPRPVKKNAIDAKKAPQEARETPFAERNYDPSNPMYLEKNLLSQEPVSRKKKQKDMSLFHGKSQVSKLAIKQDLKKYLQDPKNFALLKKKYQLNVNPADISSFVDEVVQQFPESLGGFIDESKAKLLDKQLYWDNQHMRNKKTLEQFKEAEKIRKFLKDMEGLE